jgi:hypothetical protein
MYLRFSYYDLCIFTTDFPLFDFQCLGFFNRFTQTHSEAFLVLVFCFNASAFLFHAIICVLVPILRFLFLFSLVFLFKLF